MIEETLSELKASIAKSHEALKRDLSRIRTGRASPEILDAIRVDYYGVPTPISQMASVTVPEARMLAIKAWDKAGNQMIERAIMQSDLGLNPQNDGDLIRVPMPIPTEERRKELVKQAKKVGEDIKVAIRKARHECKDMLDSIKEEGGASADDVERGIKKMEEIVSEGVGKAEEMITRKEKDILAV